MIKRLSDSDRRAVDLLLDRSAAGMGNGHGNGNVAHAQSATEPGIVAVQQVLTLLDALPADEPAADLLTRTLTRINSGPSESVQPMPPASSAMTDRPQV